MVLKKLLRMLTPKTSYAIDSNYWKGTTLEQFYKKARRQLVLVIPKLTNTQGESMKNISQDTSISETLQNLKQKNSQTLTSWWEDFRAKHLASLENVEDFQTPEVHSFLKSLGFSKTKDPDIFCLKMLKVYLVTNQEKLSRQYLKFSPSLGMYYSGKFSIVRTTESHRIGNECSLSDILEENVDQKYFLSEKNLAHLQRDFGSSGKILCKDGVSSTLSSAMGTGGGNFPCIDDVKIRRLTQTECERLQGFPDGWTDGISDTQRYKCLGNAVTTNVITEIIRRLNGY